MLVEVTQDDIDNGQPRKGESCPVALAINRAIGQGYCIVGQAILIFNDANGWTYANGRTYAMPRIVRQFIHEFDNIRTGTPFTFELK